jgi:hypothetical protein
MAVAVRSDLPVSGHWAGVWYCGPMRAGRTTMDDWNWSCELTDEERREGAMLREELLAELEASGLEACDAGAGPWYVHTPGTRCRMCGRWIS